MTNQLLLNVQAIQLCGISFVTSIADEHIIAAFHSIKVFTSETKSVPPPLSLDVSWALLMQTYTICVFVRFERPNKYLKCQLTCYC